MDEYNTIIDDILELYEFLETVEKDTAVYNAIDTAIDECHATIYNYTVHEFIGFIDSIIKCDYFRTVAEGFESLGIYPNGHTTAKRLYAYGGEDTEVVVSNAFTVVIKDRKIKDIYLYNT